MQKTVKIIPVNSRSRLARFIRLPWKIYRHDAYWVPPLLLERKMHFSAKNPYFQHARWQAWLAEIDGIDVGRISAQVDQLHLDTHRDKTGFFGLIEAENNPEIFKCLTETAEQWLVREGMQQVLGPFNLSINQESGLLVEGFETVPSILMGHAPAYYASGLERLGYKKAKDLLAFEISSQFDHPRAMQSLIGKTSDDIKLRALSKSETSADFKLMRHIFNDAWSDNWGFVPFTEAEFLDMGNTLAHLLPNDFVQIATVNGEPAGMIVMLPDLNQLIKDLDGKLLPVGWLKLLWRLKFSPPTHARIPLMGIRKHYRSTLAGTALAYTLINALQGPAERTGIQSIELSWVLENNTNLIEIIESLGGIQSRRYRVFKKDLFSNEKDA